jgi:hypothetical protein
MGHYGVSEIVCHLVAQMGRCCVTQIGRLVCVTKMRSAVSHTYTNWFEHMAHSKSLAFAYTLHVHSVCAHRPHLIQIVITTVRLILPPVSSGVFTYAQYGQHGSGVHTEGNTLALPASAASIH